LQNPDNERGKSMPPKNSLLKQDSANDDKRRGVSLGNQITLPMTNGPAGISHTIKDTLGKTTNLSNMLRHSNLLEEDGIEDLHFYFVEFNQHKRMITDHQRNKGTGTKRALLSKCSSV
jgi:hypothetical protein